MNIIFCGRKPCAVQALKYILDLGWEVSLVITQQEPNWMPHPHLGEFAREVGIPVATQRDANTHISNNFQVEYGFYLKGVDLLISYLYPYRITAPLLYLPKLGCINFHPAPPNCGGLGGYNFAILNSNDYYGCMAHFMEETFDTGDIISTSLFPMYPEWETAFSLEARTQVLMLLLFKEVCIWINSGKELPRIKQDNPYYITKKMFEDARKIYPQDSKEIVERKIRAFWYPPYPGANYANYTLVSDKILSDIAGVLHKNGG